MNIKSLSSIAKSPFRLISGLVPASNAEHPQFGGITCVLYLHMHRTPDSRFQVLPTCQCT